MERFALSLLVLCGPILAGGPGLESSSVRGEETTENVSPTSLPETGVTLDQRTWKADLPGKGQNAIKVDAKRKTFVLTTRDNADMWGNRADAPIVWSAAPEGHFAVEAKVVYPSAAVSAVAGVCLYNADGGKPDFTLGLDHWGGSQKVKLQGLPPAGNSPSVEASQPGCREAWLRLECYGRNGDARKTDAYLAYYRLKPKDKWIPLGALQRNSANRRVGLFLKTSDAQSVEFSEVAVTKLSDADLAKRLESFQTIVQNAPPRKAAPVFAVPEPVPFEGHPAVDGRTIVFIARHQYRSDHHNTATMFQTGEINTGSFQGGAAIKTLEVDSGKVTTLLKLPEGVARDLEVSFDGKRLLFSMRNNIQDDYHLYEMTLTKGSELFSRNDPAGDSHKIVLTPFVKQLTFGAGISDIDPIYLPNGQIMFGSTREPKFCMCNRHIMCNLFTMNADGSNIQQIGHSTLHEGHPALMPDGRIVYDRWEYVDRNFGDAQGAWIVNPDGTNHAIFWGNNTNSPGAVLDNRAIPGTELSIATFSSCHDRPWGALAIIDRRLGMDGRTPVVRTWPADAIDLIGKGNYDTFTRVRPKYEDPFPLDAQHFLCARMTGQGEQMGIFLLDLSGDEILLYADELGCFDPMLLESRPKPPAISPRMDLAKEEGYFYVADVYKGHGMEKIERGTVKSLRVVESPEKRFWTQQNWQGSGTQAPGMAYDDFNNKLILGTVPVEEDGSAYFAVPADRFVYFQLLDKNGMMVQSMRSGTITRPGETNGCVGCHENRRSTMPGNSTAAAMRRGPSKLTPWYGPERNFGYVVEVQPAFDKHCVSCHDYGKKAGEKLNLAGDLGVMFNTSYMELRTRGFVKVPGAGPTNVLPPMSWGSHASRLGKVMLEGHGDPEIDKQVNVDKESFDRIITWIDVNAPYYPEYASAYRENRYGRSPLDAGQLGRLGELTGMNLGDQKLSSHVSFTRPEVSLCLQQLDKSDPKYGEALAIIRAGQEMLAKRPRADMPNFGLVDRIEIDQQTKYRARLEAEKAMRAAILSGQRKYERP